VGDGVKGDDFERAVNACADAARGDGRPGYDVAWVSGTDAYMGEQVEARERVPVGRGLMPVGSLTKKSS
jgi:hypothetical protein